MDGAAQIDRSHFRRAAVISLCLALIAAAGIWTSHVTALEVCPAILPVPLSCQLELRTTVAVAATLLIAALTLASVLMARLSRREVSVLLWLVSLVLVGAVAAGAIVFLLLTRI